MKRIKYILLLLVVSIAWSGCKKDKEEGDFQDDMKYRHHGNMLIIEDQDYLLSRITYFNEIISVENVQLNILKSAAEVPEVDPTMDYTFILLNIK